jgi:hypothetical protein
VALDKYVTYSHFKFFENVQFGISISQHHIPGTASGHGSHKKVEDVCCTELVNYCNQLGKVYRHRLQQLRRSLQGLIYKQHS